MRWIEGTSSCQRGPGPVRHCARPRLEQL